MMEKKFFIQQFLKPTLMAAAPQVKDVRYSTGVNGEYLHIEFVSGFKQNVFVSDCSLINLLVYAIAAVKSE